MSSPKTRHMIERPHACGGFGVGVVLGHQRPHHRPLVHIERRPKLSLVPAACTRKTAVGVLPFGEATTQARRSGACRQCSVTVRPFGST